MTRWLKPALDLVYPRSCSSCGGGVGPDDSHVCWECKADIEMIAHPFCSICGNPLEGRIDHAYTCYLCSEQRPHFDMARAAARFRGPLARLVHQLKYHEAFWLDEDLSGLLHACCKSHYDLMEIDLMTCVPLYHVRLRERGFNQSELIGRGLAGALGRPFLPKILRRVRDTETQTHLTAPERASNVHHAFSVTRPPVVNGRHVLLVDDVMTTGATVNECARALKEAGAAEVLVVTLARGG